MVTENKNLTTKRTVVQSTLAQFKLETMSVDQFEKWNAEFVRAVYSYNIMKATLASTSK